MKSIKSELKILDKLKRSNTLSDEQYIRAKEDLLKDRLLSSRKSKSNKSIVVMVISVVIIVGIFFYYRNYKEEQNEYIKLINLLEVNNDLIIKNIDKFNSFKSIKKEDQNEWELYKNFYEYGNYNGDILEESQKCLIKIDYEISKQIERLLNKKNIKLLNRFNDLDDVEIKVLYDLGSNYKNLDRLVTKYNSMVKQSNGLYEDDTNISFTTFIFKSNIPSGNIYEAFGINR